MITNKHDDPLVHVHAGNLLMLAGSIEDASKAFTNANSIKPTLEAFVQRAKCYLLLERPETALGDLEGAEQIESTKEVQFDIEILKILSSQIDQFDLRPSVLKKLSQLSKVMQLHTEGRIFRNKHIHWYKGALYFNIGEFQKAKVEFKAALETKGEGEEAGADKDNSEVIYNLSLCYIFSDHLEAALIHLQELVYVLEGADRGKVLLIIGILHLALQDTEEARSVMLEAFKHDSVTSTAYLEERPSVEILPFACASVLAGRYALRELKVAECHPVLVRPSFGYPLVQMPSMEFTIEDPILENFAVKTVKCKPEAPWLNRVKGTIQFTEEIREIMSESVASTAKSESDNDSSIFDSSFSDIKVFRSAVVLATKDNHKQDTAELFNFVKKSEQPSKTIIMDASEEVKKRIDSICSSNAEEN